MIQVSSTPRLTDSPGVRVTAGLFAWLAAAIAAGASGVLTLERRALAPASILVLVGVLAFIYSRRGALRQLADSMDLRALILPHVIRAPIGAAFLWMWSRGELDTAFAWVGGPGDIFAGVTAIGAALLVPMTTAKRRFAVQAWNVVALADIVLTAGTAFRVLVISDHPETMSAFLEMPWPLLPFLLVPLVVGSHLLLLRRLRSDAR
jgi:hypothetical protein